MKAGNEVHVVEDVAGAFSDLVAERRPRMLSISGGSTAKRCYERLFTAGVDVAETDILISDERWVPADHVESNEGQARRVWLDHVPHGRIHSVRQAGDTAPEAAGAYNDLVTSLGTVGLLHLGLGDDGHTASLFPNSHALGIQDRYVVATGDELHDWERVTFTYPALALAALAVVTVSGAGKREAFARVLEGDPALPAAHIGARHTIWLADAAAAGDGHS